MTQGQCFSLALLPWFQTLFASFARQMAPASPTLGTVRWLSTLRKHSLHPPLQRDWFWLWDHWGVQWDPLLIWDDVECLQMLITSVTLRDVPQRVGAVASL